MFRSKRGQSVRTLINKKWQAICMPVAVFLVLSGSVARLAAQTDPACTYLMQPTSKVFDYPAEDAVISVTTQDRCPWTSGTPNDWIQIHFFTNYSGSDVVRYTAYAN